MLRNHIPDNAEILSTTWILFYFLLELCDACSGDTCTVKINNVDRKYSKKIYYRWHSQCHCIVFSFDYCNKSWAFNHSGNRKSHKDAKRLFFCKTSSTVLINRIGPTIVSESKAINSRDTAWNIFSFKTNEYVIHSVCLFGAE